MKDVVVLIFAGIASALMAASGAFSMGRLALAGVCLMFVAAAWKYAQRMKQRDIDRRRGGDRRHKETEQQEHGVPVGSR